MSATTLRVAVIGCGAVAASHRPAPAVALGFDLESWITLTETWVRWAGVLD